MAGEIRIALDAMGGDHAPGEIVKGAVHAVMHHDGMRIILVGKQEEVRRAQALRRVRGRRVRGRRQEEARRGRPWERGGTSPWCLRCP